MPTYEYICTDCGLRFERTQAITEEAITVCPHCQGTVNRLVSGGTGFIMKTSSGKRSCSHEETGMTCCGRSNRCDQPPCRE